MWFLVSAIGGAYGHEISGASGVSCPVECDVCEPEGWANSSAVFRASFRVREWTYCRNLTVTDLNCLPCVDSFVLELVVSTCSAVLTVDCTSAYADSYEIIDSDESEPCLVSVVCDGKFPEFGLTFDGPHAAGDVVNL